MQKEFNLDLIRKNLPKDKIEVFRIRHHEKASESYIDVIFKYDKIIWEGSVPIEYRRTGTSTEDETDIVNLLKNIYVLMNPNNFESWSNDQDVYWRETNKKVTHPFFEGLKDCKWKCVSCQLPKNPNWARRIQDLKELGYTLSTNTNMRCDTCNKNTTHLILLPIPRGDSTGYEIISPGLKGNIIKILNSFDVYEDRMRTSLLPDHKFPEIRWDKDTRENNPADMNKSEIREKFQLLSNQRNQQKREVCRKCYHSGIRGYPFGIKFYYEGNAHWPVGIPTQGKDAEKGCVGCGWYDMERWRALLNKKIH